MPSPTRQHVPTPPADFDEVARALTTIHPRPLRFEVRGFDQNHRGSGTGTSRVFDDVDDAVAWLQAEDGPSMSWYYCLNPVSDDRHQNARDIDITTRRWLLIDADPVKADGHKDDAASESEKASARKVSDAVAADLASQGWVSPIRLDSGNGFHLLFPVDLPNDADSTTLIRLVLRALDAAHSTPEAKIDLVVFNAARVARLPGMPNRRGVATKDRPHRVARLLDAKQRPHRHAVRREKLEAVAAPEIERERLKQVEADRAAKARQAEAKARMAARGGELPLGALQRYAAAALKAEAKALSETEPGGRNPALFRAGAKIGSLIAADVLELDDAQDELWDAALAAGLLDGEIEATLPRAIKAGMETPRDLSGVIGPSLKQRADRYADFVRAPNATELGRAIRAERLRSQKSKQTPISNPSFEQGRLL